MTSTACPDSDSVGPLLERIAPDLVASGVQASGFREIESCGPLVADRSTKVVIEDESGRPEAVLLLANRTAPGSVTRSMARAREVAARLGPKLGSVALQPLLCGEFGGLSYAVLPWQRSLADTRWRWRVQKTWLAPRLLRWLRAVLRTTIRDLDEAQLDSRVRDPLRRLIDDGSPPA